MHYQDIEDRQIALMVWNVEREDDVHIYLGKIITEGSALVFVNNAKGWRVSISNEQMAAPRRVDNLP